MMFFFENQTILLPLSLFQIWFHRVKLIQCETWGAYNGNADKLSAIEVLETHLRRIVIN